VCDESQTGTISPAVGNAARGEAVRGLRPSYAGDAFEASILQRRVPAEAVPWEGNGSVREAAGATSRAAETKEGHFMNDWSNYAWFVAGMYAGTVGVAAAFATYWLATR